MFARGSGSAREPLQQASPEGLEAPVAEADGISLTGIDGAQELLVALARRYRRFARGSGGQCVHGAKERFYDRAHQRRKGHPLLVGGAAEGEDILLHRLQVTRVRAGQLCKEVT